MLHFLAIVFSLLYLNTYIQVNGQPQSTQFVVGKTVSNGYQLPAAKQGVDQERYFTTFARDQKWDTATQQARYNAVSNLVGHKVHKRNVFWHQLESTTLPSSNDSSLTCASNHFKWPSNETHRLQVNATWYHCMVTVTIKLLDSVFALDKQNNLETAAVVWGTPSQYMHPNCTGNSQLGRLPCPPSIEMTPAFYDFMAFCATRWPSIVHYIIGNEVDSSAWFDPSPYSNNVNRSIVNTSDADAWITRYVDLFTTAHRAIARNRNGKPIMMYVSTDRMWTASPWCPGPKWGSRCPLGTVNLLNGIWSKIGTTIDWSVSVHPYGVVNGSDWKLVAPYQAYTFQDLTQVIAYQKAKLGLKASDICLAPQCFIAATEQSWSSGLPAEAALTAYYICLAHNISVSNLNIVFTTHLDLQNPWGPGPNQNGIIPLAAGNFLNQTGAADFVTLKAYGSTNPSVWGRTSQHFCCQSYSLGCPPSLKTHLG